MDRCVRNPLQKLALFTYEIFLASLGIVFCRKNGFSENPFFQFPPREALYEGQERRRFEGDKTDPRRDPPQDKKNLNYYDEVAAGLSVSRWRGRNGAMAHRARPTSYHIRFSIGHGQRPGPHCAIGGK